MTAWPRNTIPRPAPRPEPAPILSPAELDDLKILEARLVEIEKELRGWTGRPPTRRAAAGVADAMLKQHTAVARLRFPR